MRRIVVLGCGFGGLKAARRLERSLMGRRRVHLTVVSDRSHFVYTPLLPNVATGELGVSHITFPLREALDKSTELIVERVEGIDLDERVLHGHKSRIEFDYLLVACGAQTDWNGHTWQSNALTCKSARDGVRLYEALASSLQQASACASSEARQRRLTFVIAGAGPTGVEVAAELLSTLRNEIAPTSSGLAEAARVVLIERDSGILPRWPKDLGQLTRAYLRQNRLEMRPGTEVVGRSANEVELSTGEVIAADHLIWCGGVRAPSFLSDTGLSLDETGRINVDATLQARGQAGIYAIGDVANAGHGTDQSAQVASQQAPVAARNLVAALAGRAPRDWEHEHRGYLLSLGRENALAHVGDTLIEGRAARALYRLVHTALMPTAIKKASLFKDWLLTGSSRRSQRWELLEATSPHPQLGHDEGP